MIAPPQRGRNLKPEARTPAHILHLVPPRPTPRPSPLALWHLLSLDAPTAAALWTAFIGHGADVSLPTTSVAAMFVAVWMLYAADRLLDARPAASGAPAEDLEERHLFHHRHRRAFLGCFLAASLLLAALLHTLPASALHLYALLAAPLAAYLLLIHARALPAAGRLPKELAVGIFFPAAVFIPTVARAPRLRLDLLFPALLFAAVCTLNCLFVYAWEHPGDRTNAHPTTRWATARLPALAVATATLAVFCTALVPHLAPITLACALSAILLLTLHRSRRRISALHLRALADAALLTPILLWPLAGPAMKPANFDRVARLYRWAEYAALGPLLQRTRTTFLAEILGQRHALLLGDGDGRFAARMLHADPSLRATAVDSSAAMLKLLGRRCALPPSRLTTIQVSLTAFTPDQAPDLIVSHFVLDCFTQPDVDALVARLGASATPGALWLLSDFGPLRSPALRWLGAAYVRALYAAFRVLTGLRVNRLPDPQHALQQAGFRLLRRRERLGGLLYTELWQSTRSALPADYNHL